MLTLGHGRLERDELAALLQGAGIEALVDVRRYPGSRHNSAAAQGEIERLATDAGIHYRHDPRLGGRRHLTAAEDAESLDTWWRVAAFRAYADWTRSDEFREAMGELIAEAERQRTAVLCSEAVWWRCHRRIIADVATLAHGMPVEHLMHDGRLTPHAPSDGARVVEGRGVVWDG